MQLEVMVFRIARDPVGSFPAVLVHDGHPGSEIHPVTLGSRLYHGQNAYSAANRSLIVKVTDRHWDLAINQFAIHFEGRIAV